MIREMIYPNKRKEQVAQRLAAVQGNNSVAGLNKSDIDKPYKVGYIAGVFDLFHIGHLNMFKRAKEQCRYLIVGVVSDEGVRLNKQAEPFVPFDERIEMVRSCKYVDEAIKLPLDFCERGICLRYIILMYSSQEVIMNMIRHGLLRKNSGEEWFNEGILSVHAEYKLY